MSVPTGARRPRAAYIGPERRKPEIVEHASREFALHGYRGASMRTIARNAGVVKAVLYDCFPGGKAELYEAVIARASERFESSVIGPIDPDATPSGMLAAGLRGFIGFLDDEPFALSLLVGANGTSGAVAARLMRAREGLVNTLLAGLWRAVARTPDAASVTPRSKSSSRSARSGRS